MSHTIRWNRVRRAAIINSARLSVLCFVLLTWEYLPTVKWFQDRSPVFNRFFVSSPSRIWDRLSHMMTGAGPVSLWPYLWRTLEATLIGVVIGTALGACFGLVMSNNRMLSDIARPFIVVLNATPRIALIPIIVIIAGPTLTATVITSVFVIFFLVFYNAFTGGESVPEQSLQNARLLGATPLEIMTEIRARYVLVWTFASLPNAISFGLIATVTAELLTGGVGMGGLLSVSIQSIDSTLTFSVVVVLTIVGVVGVGVSEYAKRRALHWWIREPGD